MIDAYAAAYAASHSSLAKIRAKMPRAVKYYGIPDIVTTPYCSGADAVGGDVTVTMGTWTFEPTAYAYQWLRNGQDIAGATANAYTLAADDEEQMISARVVASNAVGSAYAVSNEWGPILP